MWISLNADGAFPASMRPDPNAPVRPEEQQNLASQQAAGGSAPVTCASVPPAAAPAPSAPAPQAAPAAASAPARQAAPRKAGNSAKEDSWAFVKIGAPFPDRPMRVMGQQNQYVALWYKHGKPVQGRAWNNGGVVECSFPYNGHELTGKRDLGGDIQILTYNALDQWEGFPVLGYWYRWVKYSERNTTDGLELCHCANVAPIFGKAKNGEDLCGNIDIASETVSFSYGGKEETITDGRVINEMYVIGRCLRAPPPKHELPKQKLDMWVDLKSGDAFPTNAAPIAALGRQLKQEDGSSMYQYVCLWYKHGEPVMGRCWDNNGRLAATFGWDGKEFSGNVGSMQVLSFPSDRMAFAYDWLPFETAIANYRNEGPWQPMHVGDCAPCVLTAPGGVERLGKVLMSQEKASAAFNGKEDIVQGPAVKQLKVLCRNPPQPRNSSDPTNA